MSEIDFNCDCESISNFETLAELRRRMMIRLGYAAQADNPPPGMAILLDDFLQSAQKQLYKKNPSLRTTRFYRWTMTPGQRYYGIRDNDSSTEFSDISCNKHIDPYQVTGVWVEDLNGAWLPLICGINPENYVTVAQEGLPTLYTVRSCIEIFPAPNAAYTLWMEGQFDLEPFTANTDRTTIDSELVFLLALGNAKKHYGKSDADDVLQQAGNYLLDTIAGKHLTKRYIPGTVRLPPAIQPVATHYFPNP